MESLRARYTKGRPNQQVPYYMVALFGATAGGASVLGNTPVDVIKTNMQNGTYKSTVDCVKSIYRQDGIRGFYKGCLPRLNRVCIEVGLAFCIFDSIQSLFGIATRLMRINPGKIYKRLDPLYHYHYGIKPNLVPTLD